MLALDYKRKQADREPGLMFCSLSFTSYAVSQAICSHRTWPAFGFKDWTTGLKDSSALSRDLWARRACCHSSGMSWLGGRGRGRGDRGGTQVAGTIKGWGGRTPGSPSQQCLQESGNLLAIIETTEHLLGAGAGVDSSEAVSHLTLTQPLRRSTSITHWQRWDSNVDQANFTLPAHSVSNSSVIWEL